MIALYRTQGRSGTGQSRVAVRIRAPALPSKDFAQAHPAPRRWLSNRRFFISNREWLPPTPAGGGFAIAAITKTGTRRFIFGLQDRRVFGFSWPSQPARAKAPWRAPARAAGSSSDSFPRDSHRTSTSV